MLRESGVVETVGCSCIAGLGRSCSHAAAILWKVQNAVISGKTGLACTDEQHRWNAGTAKNLEPKRLSQINFRHHRAEEQYDVNSQTAVTQSLPNTPYHLTHQDFIDSVSKAPVKPLFLLKNTLIGKCYNASPSAGLHRNSKVDEQFFQPHQAHSYELSCNPCRAFYQAYIQVSEEQAEQLQEETKEQSASDLWHNCRKIRLTASSAKKVPVRATTKNDKFLSEHMYPSFRGNYETNYGKENEVRACHQLKEQGMNIRHMGSVISIQEPWLSASPDGVIDSDVLLEIKCPVPTYPSLTEQLTQKCSDIKLVDGELQLQKTGSRGYYMQVQLTMFCTGLKTATLVIWTPSEQVSFTVQYDEAFVKEQVKRLRGFYFSYFLPRLVEEYAAGRFQLNERYLKIMGKV
ncbi:unnamed protein product [Oreochromis niloticus]|nr:unnamed protein product [Mustela putorius furo]